MDGLGAKMPKMPPSFCAVRAGILIKRELKTCREMRGEQTGSVLAQAARMIVRKQLGHSVIV
jgi:hypothetical protein